MREILFRGKTKDGEWVEGFLFKYGCECCIAEDNIRVSDRELSYYCYDVVDPKTISEFTSLTDKNGTKIFEGDIVRCYFADGYEEKGVIKWSDEDVRFAFVPLDEEYRWGIDNTDKFEVIGNIHDNPELLKGE